MSIAVLYAAALAAALMLLGSLLGRSFSQSLGLVAGNFLSGFGALALINWLAPTLGFYLPINPVTLLAGGCLGLPGTALAAALQTLA